MSGVEIVGLAASVLQIADLGWKSSYKLYAFSRKVHEAGKTIELISQDIAATGAVLQQLGDELKKDEASTSQHRLCSKGLIDAATKLVDECRTLFREIDQGITGAEGNKVILGFRQKLKWSYLEPRVDLLRTNLERLKSSLALMLNVLIYAEQQRSREEKSVLMEQQTLVASLATQSMESETRVGSLKKTIQDQDSSSDIRASNKLSTLESENETEKQQKLSTKQTQYGDINLPSERGLHTTAVTSNLLFQQLTAISSPVLTPKVTKQDESSKNTPNARPESSPRAPNSREQLEHHTALIDKILDEINSSKYAIDHGVRYRLYDGVLELHWREWAPLRSSHGDGKLLDILSQSKVLARHWYDETRKVDTVRRERLEYQRAIVDLVGKVTNSDLTSASWEEVQGACDMVSSRDEGCKVVVAAMIKRMDVPNPDVHLRVLELTNALSHTCGSPMHREMASMDFTNALTRLAEDSSGGNRIISLLLERMHEWTWMFSDNLDFVLMERAYSRLRVKVGLPPLLDYNHQRQGAARESLGVSSPDTSQQLTPGLPPLTTERASESVSQGQLVPLSGAFLYERATGMKERDLEVLKSLPSRPSLSRTEARPRSQSSSSSSDDGLFSVPLGERARSTTDKPTLEAGGTSSFSNHPALSSSSSETHSSLPPQDRGRSTPEEGGPSTGSANDSALNPMSFLGRQRTAEMYRREAERKQKAYLEARADRNAFTNPRLDDGFRGSAVVDFDSPRLPFEDEQKKQSRVIPRKPPTTQPGWNTLVKVDSLARKSAEGFNDRERNPTTERHRPRSRGSDRDRSRSKDQTSPAVEADRPGGGRRSSRRKRIPGWDDGKDELSLSVAIGAGGVDGLVSKNNDRDVVGAALAGLAADLMVDDPRSRSRHRGRSASRSRGRRSDSPGALVPAGPDHRDNEARFRSRERDRSATRLSHGVLRSATFSPDLHDSWSSKTVAGNENSIAATSSTPVEAEDGEISLADTLLLQWTTVKPMVGL